MKKMMVICIIFLLTGTFVFAAGNSKTIEVLLNTINIQVDGQKVDADNILYEGTTYVPLRAVAQMVGKEVGWIETSNTATIENKASESEVRPIVQIEMVNGKTFEMELYPEKAPKTVENFISLVEDGFYNGLTFHRIEPGFVIQGGDPNGDGTGGPGYNIQGEFMQNGVQNDLMHTRGIVSMARATDPNSAGSQFFIMLKDAHYLNGEYAAFGKVIKGMDIIDEIVAAGGKPKMKTVTIK